MRLHTSPPKKTNVVVDIYIYLPVVFEATPSDIQLSAGRRRRRREDIFNKFMASGFFPPLNIRTRIHRRRGTGR